MELYVRSWNCIPALGTALKLIEMPSISWNCMQPCVTLGKLGSPLVSQGMHTHCNLKEYHTGHWLFLDLSNVTATCSILPSKTFLPLAQNFQLKFFSNLLSHKSFKNLSLTLMEVKLV